MSKGKERVNPETGELRDFDIVTHVIPVDGKLFKHLGDEYRACNVYINRYGLVIGALVLDVMTNELHSWDPSVWEEYSAQVDCGESGRY